MQKLFLQLGGRHVRGGEAVDRHPQAAALRPVDERGQVLDPAGQDAAAAEGRARQYELEIAVFVFGGDVGIAH